ncbi:GntR family transcriptional regulator [Desulfonema ishimotonii]|uniref:GntR family transcriptional regulator n=1 Tax=Desulfonema ishimotonii TaxID=45657 RepID=A0A401FWW2_9BACT|nr:GntR family transcriptional regulator [Desulfonema ishimotonii]GBC61468.1 GntR family transcriptional regulator [Desulfonema ishimotonii]
MKATNKKKAEKGHTRKAYAGIRQMMFRNEITPGQKIAYRDLAERLGMSQTPIIQALKWLEFQGLVRHEPNRGYYTEPVSLQEVGEIYELRELIEISLLPETLKRMGRDELQQLRSALDAHFEASREIYLCDRLVRDMEFHLTLAALSGRNVQQQALRNLFDLLYLKYGGNILFSTSMERADSDHRELFDAVSDRNLKGARRILSRHIGNVKAHVLKGLERMQGDRPF